SQSDLRCSKASGFVHQHSASSVGTDTKSYVGSLSFFHLRRESAEIQNLPPWLSVSLILFFPQAVFLLFTMTHIPASDQAVGVGFSRGRRGRLSSSRTRGRAQDSKPAAFQVVETPSSEAPKRE
ncbi:hypothetical protein DVH24_019495, partial [Malus domestica]